MIFLNFYFSNSGDLSDHVYVYSINHHMCFDNFFIFSLQMKEKNGFVDSIDPTNLLTFNYLLRSKTWYKNPVHLFNITRVSELIRDVHTNATLSFTAPPTEGVYASIFYILPISRFFTVNRFLL